MVIKIFGGEGEGKTTLAQWLTEELTKFGIEVCNEDEGPLPSLPLPERLAILGTKTGPLKVSLKTIPSRVESVPEYAQKFKAQKPAP